MDAMNSFEHISVANRLGQYFSSIGTSIHQVTKRCGFTRGALDKMLRKGGGLHSDTIASVLANYPELDADWLILGIGDMKRASPRNVVDTPTGHVSKLRNPKPKPALELEELQEIRRLLEERQGHRRKGGDSKKGAA